MSSIGPTSNYGQSRVGTLSGSTISWGSTVQYGANAAFYHRVTSIGGTSKVAVLYRETSSGDPISIQVGTISGTSISSYGSKVVVNDASGSQTQWYDQDISYDENSQRLLIAYKSTVSKPYYPCIQLASISGTFISLEGTIYDIETQAVSTNSGVQYLNLAYDSNNENYILSYTDNNGTSSPATSNTFSIGNGSNFIGIASESISDAATGEVTILGGINESLTGLTVSADYYVNTNVAGGVSTSTGSNIKIGRALSATKLLITQGNTQ